MENRRQSKMASLLKQTMGEILLKEAKSHIGSNVLVSITQVKISPDLSIARFYLSVFGGEDPQMSVDILNTTSYEWRKKMGSELRHHLRKIPEIEFFMDDSIEYAQKMNDLFKDLKKKDSKEEEE